ncbi:MAG: GNAT family N-acetyltransferase [Pseudomonadota bacterium]
MQIPTLETERLILRAPCLDDLGAYTAFCMSDRSAGVGGPFEPIDVFQKLAALIGHWSLRGYGRWMVTDKMTQEPLGIVGPMYPPDWPEPEIAWTVFAAAEGRSVAYEAAIAARGYVYETLGWTTAISCTMADNTRSIALARRLGARQEENFVHPLYGEMFVWRHPTSEALA